MFKENLFAGLDHKDLINSLKEKLSNDKPAVSSPAAKVQTTFVCGNGSLADNMKLVNQYICACGAETETFMHSFHSDNEGKALDSYHLNCNSCGNEERVSFHMLRESLKRTKDVPIFVKKSKLYPYV